MTDEYLTLAEAAKYLKVSKSTMRRWLVEGRGPPVTNLGERLLRYRRSELDDWVLHPVRHGSKVGNAALS